MGWRSEAERAYEEGGVEAVANYFGIYPEDDDDEDT